MKTTRLGIVILFILLTSIVLQAQLADKDIVYLYLAGEDSPENTWSNMVPDNLA